jgi:predicted ATPase
MSGDSESKSFKQETRSGYKLPERFVRYMERYKQIWASDPGLQDYLLTNWLERYLPFFDKISTDISSGNSYNFVPSRVREPEDIAQAPVINSDGSGLAATLFQLKNVASGVRPHRMYGRPVYGRPAFFSSDAFAKVKAFFLLVNPNISNIDVRSDAYENKLKVFAEVRTNDGQINMPLNFLSDGTIKWLALVTAITTSKSYFAIEEPENYIHPKMQQEFANIVRAACEEDNERFALITTHSETLLNAVLPHEMVIVSMEDGRTVAKSLFDPKLISKEISRTGFGLGYYYITEALDA